MSFNLTTGNHVLLLWNSPQPPAGIEQTVASLREQAGETGKVQLENVSIVSRSNHPSSSYDVAISQDAGSGYVHEIDILGEVLRILKPNGTLYVTEQQDARSTEALCSALKLSGFTNVAELSVPAGESPLKTSQFSAQKPNFEVGKSSRLPLKFTKKVKEAPKTDVAKVWTLDADDVDEIDIIDSDKLLDEVDLKRPDPSTLKSACGPKSGKKRACKGCTCGLQEELDTGVISTEPKSACGSCYLGDAFRCASCPYLGMPPFKPGEKISLSDRQLNPDLQA